MCSLYRCFRNAHSKWLCVDSLWKFIVLNCPQNFSFLICAAAVCWLHTRPQYSRAGTRLQRAEKGFYFLPGCSVLPKNRTDLCLGLGAVRLSKVAIDFMELMLSRAHTKACVCHMYMRCGKWNLALIFNHTFESQKSNPLSHQFSLIQFRRKRKKKKKWSDGITFNMHSKKLSHKMIVDFLTSHWNKGEFFQF